jgi:thiamine-phosphate pyrophosphorylase
MTQKLVAWARAVKSRRHGRALRSLPPLWLFTDAARLPDPRTAVARLPPGLAGVVLRHDGQPERASLGRDLARLCRARRLILVVAGDARLAAALHAGLHLRGGRRAGPWPNGRLLTSSAHDAAELHRARRAGANLAFLSPFLPTASHPGAPALGPHRWAALACRAGLPVAALGGIDRAALRRLPSRACAGIGAIGALSP